MNNHSGSNRAKQPGRARLTGHWLRAKPFVYATIIIGIAAGIAPILQRLPHANLSLLFMTSVLIVAVRYGLWPSIYSSVLSFMTFNFFFTAPYGTFAVSQEGDVATLVFFLVMASVSGNLAARLRDAMTKREAAIMRASSLQNLTRQVAGAATTEQVLEYLVNRFVNDFGYDAVAIVTEAQRADTHIIYSGTKSKDDLIDWRKIADTEASVDGWTFLSFHTARGSVGRIGIKRPALTREESDYADALTDQAAVALERTVLVSDLEEAKLVSEREQLRSALLSSVSHDLRTPLSSIIGATTSLIAYAPSLDRADQSTLLETVLEEAERLDRYIQNLLDMTRLGQGELALQCDWEDIRDLLSSAARRLRFAKRGIRFESNIANDAQFILVNGDLFEQVLVNLLDNAARYSAPDSPISVSARREGGAVIIDVADHGPGIPAADRDRVFEPFYRVHERDRKHGTGLGLSICRGIVRAHDGHVSAHATPGGGALLRLEIPQPEADQLGQVK